MRKNISVYAAAGTNRLTGLIQRREERYGIYSFAADEKQEREKDYEPFNSMLKLIKKFDRLRIYKLD